MLHLMIGCCSAFECEFVVQGVKRTYIHFNSILSQILVIFVRVVPNAKWFFHPIYSIPCGKETVRKCIDKFDFCDSVLVCKAGLLLNPFI